MASPGELDGDLPDTQPVDDRVLKNVVAYVEVRSTNDNRSEAVRRELDKLGATVVKKFTNDVTHVIFKEGSNRTKTKAQKMGVHFVSVLWVESCKQNETRVSERMYPAVVPRQKGPHFVFAAKLKKAKSMQPRDFEEDLANSAERLCRKKKRIDVLSRLCSGETTPYSSPRSPMILAQDTQPRSPDDGYVLTPVRLTIPETPPSMREKMKQLLLAKQGVGSHTETDAGDVSVGNREYDPLQRKLFKSSVVSCEFSSPGSPNTSSVFTSDHGDTTIEDEPGADVASDSSVTEDILDIAIRINATMSHQARRYSHVTESDKTTRDQLLATPAITNKRFSSVNVDSHETTHDKQSATPVIADKRDSSVNIDTHQTKHGKSKMNKRDSSINADADETTHDKRSEAPEKTKYTPRVNYVSHEAAGAEQSATPERVNLFGSLIAEDNDIATSFTLRLSNESVCNKTNDESKESNDMKASRRKSRASSVSFRVGEKLVKRRNPRRSSVRQAVIVLDADDRDAGLKGTPTTGSSTAGIPVSTGDSGEDEDPIPKKCQNKNELSSGVNSCATKIEEKKIISVCPEDNISASTSVNKSDTMLPMNNSDDSPRSSHVESQLPPDIAHQPDTNSNTKMQAKTSRRKSSRIKSLHEETRSPTCSTSSVENRADRIENLGKVKEDKTAEKPFTEIKAKRTMKKKLLSLTDLNDQHSVLVEPTKCSEVRRPQLIEDEVKTKKCSKKKTRDTMTGDKKNENLGPKSKEYTSNGRKRKSNSPSSGTTSGESVAKPKQSKEKFTLISNENNVTSTQKNVNILANDTAIEDTDMSISQKNSSQLQDLTTQLNLTKDNTLTGSVWENALSHSMSVAYTDTTIPSFLQPRRQSVDEFSASQRANKKKSIAKRSVLATVKENKQLCDSQISVNDMSSRLSIMRFIETTTHRKNIRPSIVMTSLHSYEQDVVIAVVKKLGGFVISESVNETTTHVVCGESRRTLNVLHGLVRGIWLLSKEWVLMSLEEGHWIPEHEFERFNQFPTCKVAREEREACAGIYRQDLLKTLGPVYVSGRACPPRPHLVQLIKLCGGQVTGTLGKAKVYVGGDLHPGIVCVKTQWLLDSITEHQLFPLETYSLDRPKRESSPVY